MKTIRNFLLSRRFQNTVLALLVVAGLLVLAYLRMFPPAGNTVVTRTLEAQGFTEIELHTALLGECAEGEIPTGFRAINRDGQPVAGVVCESLVLQNVYIRFK